MVQVVLLETEEKLLDGKERTLIKECKWLDHYSKILR